MTLSFHTEHDPVYLQSFVGRFSYAELDAHFSELEELCIRMADERPDWRPAVFADMRSSGKMDARGRRRVSTCFERLAPVIGRRCVAHAVVVPSKVASGILTAILWVQRPPWTIQSFSDPHDANRWIARRYAEEGLPVPNLPPLWWERGRTRGRGATG